MSPSNHQMSSSFFVRSTIVRPFRKLPDKTAEGTMRFVYHAAVCLVACRHPLTAPRPHQVCMAESEMQWRRRMAEGSGSEAADEPSDAQGEAPNMATSVDQVDFFGGAGGGGTLTREGIDNARRTRSRTIDAMDALSAALKNTGDLPADEAAEELSRVIGLAYEAGVPVSEPPMKRAAALLTALEAAKEGDSQRAARPDADSDALDSKLDALFGSGYAPPPDL